MQQGTEAYSFNSKMEFLYFKTSECNIHTGTTGWTVDWCLAALSAQTGYIMP